MARAPQHEIQVLRRRFGWPVPWYSSYGTTFNGGDRANRAVCDPLDAAFAEVVYGPYFFFLITHPRGNVLFDTGLNPKWARRKRRRGGARS